VDIILRKKKVNEKVQKNLVNATVLLKLVKVHKEEIVII